MSAPPRRRSQLLAFDSEVGIAFPFACGGKMVLDATDSAGAESNTIGGVYVVADGLLGAEVDAIPVCHPIDHDSADVADVPVEI